MRFDLIDQVLEHHPDRLVAVKNVTTAEEYLADHFPGFPVLPGVMMLETLVQAARLLLSGQPPEAMGEPYWPADRGDPQPLEGGRGGQAASGAPMVLTEVRNVRYGQMVRPGQCLMVEVAIRSQNDQGCELTGVGRVEGQVAVQGRFRIQPFEPATPRA